MPSRQSSPRTCRIPDLDRDPVLGPDQPDDAGPDRVRPHRRAQREGAPGGAVIGRALPHQVAPGAVEPVQHLQALVARDAVEGRAPGGKHLDPAGRPVGPALARAAEPVGPGRADAADEDEAGIVRGGQLDRDLAARISFRRTMRASSLPRGSSLPPLRAGRALTKVFRLRRPDLPPARPAGAVVGPSVETLEQRRLAWQSPGGSAGAPVRRRLNRSRRSPAGSRGRGSS